MLRKPQRHKIKLVRRNVDSNRDLAYHDYRDLNAGKSTLDEPFGWYKKMLKVGNKPGVWQASNGSKQIKIWNSILQGSMAKIWRWNRSTQTRINWSYQRTSTRFQWCSDDFRLNYFLKHITLKVKNVWAKWIDDEAPEIIMDMTRILGFRDDYDRFYNLFRRKSYGKLVTINFRHWKI